MNIPGISSQFPSAQGSGDERHHYHMRALGRLFGVLFAVDGRQDSRAK